MVKWTENGADHKEGEFESSKFSNIKFDKWRGMPKRPRGAFKAGRYSRRFFLPSNVHVRMTRRTEDGKGE